MLSQSINKLPRQTIERLILTVPFYKQLQQLDEFQYELLIQHSRILTFEARETVLAQGSKDNWLYCLLKGQCQVLAGEPEQQVNEVIAGEVFGDLSLLMGQPRTASVVANAREVQVLATDFSIFGAADNLIVVNLTTKLCYYRNLAQNLRWKLDVYRRSHPDFSAADSHRRSKFFTGEKNSIAELKHLHQQCRDFAGLLLEWNKGFNELQHIR